MKICRTCHQVIAPGLYPAIAYRLKKLLRDLPEDITESDLARHPDLARIVLLADELGNRVRLSALDYAKRTHSTD